jgi:crotonobetainyl-CoA:carnitine CoA-transferase CaiB-like acyl-CoA transferase
VAVTDILTGMYACVAILAAVNARVASGVGQYIDMALLDCIVAFGASQANSFLVTGKVPGRSGNAHPNMVPYQVFATQDGHIIVACGNDNQWQRLCAVMARDDLARNARFAKVTGRIINRAELVPELERVMLTRSSAEWLATLEAAGIPGGPINDYAAVFADPQVRHRRLQVELPQPDGGALPGIASPLRLSETPVEYRTAPPTLGQDTDDVLCAVLGKTMEQIEQLASSGTIGR